MSVSASQNTDKFSKIMGGNLKKLRLRHGYTQKQIAIILGVSFQQIQKYETGQNRLPIEKLTLLKDLYDVPFESFFTANAGMMQRPDFQTEKIENCIDRFVKIEDFTRQSRILKILNTALEL